jgi:hypothetical protein
MSPVTDMLGGVELNHISIETSMPILTYGLELIWEHLSEIHLAFLERVKANSASRSSLMAPVIRLSVESLEKDGCLGCKDV